MSRMIEEMDDAPRARQFAAQIDRREKLPELPKGTRMDGTPEGGPRKDPVMERALEGLAEKMRENGMRIASTDAARCNGTEKESEYGTISYQDMMRVAEKAAEVMAKSGVRIASPDAAPRNDTERETGNGETGNRGRIASPNSAPRNDREDEGHMEDARKDESRPRCGMLKADVQENGQSPVSVRQRVTRKDVWIVGHWIMMQREGERCSLAFLREPCVLKGTRDEAQGIVHEIIAELEEALDAMGDGEEAR